MIVVYVLGALLAYVFVGISLGRASELVYSRVEMYPDQLPHTRGEHVAFCLLFPVTHWQARSLRELGENEEPLVVSASHGRVYVPIMAFFWPLKALWCSFFLSIRFSVWIAGLCLAAFKWPVELLDALLRKKPAPVVLTDLEKRKLDLDAKRKQRDQLTEIIEREEHFLAAKQLAEHSPFRAPEDVVEVSASKA